MSNFISEQLAKYLNQRMTAIGTIETLDLDRDAIRLVVALRGETERVRLDVTGLAWSTSEGKFRVHYATATASKEWIQGLLDLIGERNGRCLSFPDSLKLAPVKMILPKAR